MKIQLLQHNPAADLKCTVCVSAVDAAKKSKAGGRRKQAAADTADKASKAGSSNDEGIAAAKTFAEGVPALAKLICSRPTFEFNFPQGLRATNFSAVSESSTSRTIADKASCKAFVIEFFESMRNRTLIMADTVGVSFKPSLSASETVETYRHLRRFIYPGTRKQSNGILGQGDGHPTLPDPWKMRGTAISPGLAVVGSRVCEDVPTPTFGGPPCLSAEGVVPHESESQEEQQEVRRGMNRGDTPELLPGNTLKAPIAPQKKKTEQ